MKAVTEFANFILVKANQTKTALLAEGKTPEEVQASLGEAFKLEGEKINFFIQALEVFSQNSDNLKRVLVMRLAEGEKAPHKSTQIEDLVYVPEFYVDPKARAQAGKEGRGGKGRGGKGGRAGDRGKKESPWGLSPEEKAAKNKPATPKA